MGPPSTAEIRAFVPQGALSQIALLGPEKENAVFSRMNAGSVSRLKESSGLSWVPMADYADLIGATSKALERPLFQSMWTAASNRWSEHGLSRGALAVARKLGATPLTIAKSYAQGWPMVTRRAGTVEAQVGDSARSIRLVWTGTPTEFLSPPILSAYDIAIGSILAMANVKGTVRRPLPLTSEPRVVFELSWVG